MIEETNVKLVTSIPGPKSKAIFEERKKYVASGVSVSTEIAIAEAKGALIKDVDGNVFLDFAAAIGVQNAGHCDEEIVKAIKDQTEKYIHPGYNIVTYESYGTLAKKLTEITTGDFEKKVMFANSGAEALENAIKIARTYTKKTGILSATGSFHGRTNMTMSITSKYKPYKNGFGPFAPETYKFDYPYAYRAPLGVSSEEYAEECIKKLRTMLKTTISPDMIACLIVEPLQGEGGFVVPTTKYMQELQKICNENNIVFIVDEVQAGFARTGKMFAYEYYGIEPDVVTLSKSIAAGVPLSAVVAKKEIIDSACVGGIGGTYCGSPIGCVAALKVIEKIEKENLCEKSLKLGEYIAGRLNSMKEKFDVIGEVRGLGSMIGIEFVKDRTTKEPAADIVKAVIKRCYKNGVIFLNAGLFGNVIRFLPPLVMTEEQVKYGMDVLEESIKECI
ncbi:4-aminobutyrate--2-oxoglutarate transaminase [Clostridium cibarium]|uniref:(S)-3-amino-2-methylpropionate transaminase n=1 Tax=Clostridium cibarium TaxID=2762247 RepID=A0ABR8PS52_9CLOT|nr:4-aminobutyrate--2-oxoglutarate transaminase [Clostridium cibarium]MBD7910999.1 4-aminobutyrate--2-oxoglutarate transaminase [Clostridium cibarium]